MPAPRLTRRTLLIGGGAGVGLALAWGVWPRRYRPALPLGPGERMMNGFLKIGVDGHVAVAVPQAEMGQGVYTALPQILADELGADWRTVAVEPSPIGPLYANDFLVREAAREALPGFLQSVGQWAAHELATRTALMMTGGSSSVRGFEARYRMAGATARAMLCMAAAKRWGIDWQACDTEAGFVVHGDDRLRFADLVEEAAGLTPPDDVPLRAVTPAGRSAPRLDLPGKVDGSARYAGDVRLPDLIYAAIAIAPPGGGPAGTPDQAAARRVPGAQALYRHDRWVAATGTTSWAAQRALAAAAPAFAAAKSPPDDGSIARALAVALAAEGAAFVEEGALPPATLTADYRVGLVPHAAIEPMAATARMTGDRIELWVQTQAPGLLRAAVARALAMAEDRVTIYPMLLGGSFGGKIETDAAVQAAVLAARSGRPVQLTWDRATDFAHDRYRPPALARLSATLSGQRITGWQARIAAPSAAGEVMRRIMPSAPMPSGAEASAVDGARPPYAIPAVRVAHHPADIGIATGMWRSVSHSYTAFFTECFVDELAAAAGVDPLSFRMGMLGGNPRLARCLSTAAALGGWEGGGGAQGLACHSSFGSHVAMLAEVAMDGGRPRCTRIAAVVDCGRTINPDIVRQQVEGGIVFGLSATLGAAVHYEGGRCATGNFDALALPGLADCPEILVTLIQSGEAPGGVGEIAVPPVAPAVMNAVASATGRRLRAIPIG